MSTIPRDRDPDLQQAVGVYLRRLHAESTRASYARELRRFMQWLAQQSPINPETLPEYVQSLRDRSLSPTSVAWRATVVGELLRDTHRQGVIAIDPTIGYKKPKGTRGFAPRVLSSGELKRLLRTPDRRSWTGKRDLAVLVCLGIGGLRAGEVCSLRLCDVEITLSRVTLRIRGKGNRVRVIAFESKNAGPIRSWAVVRGTGKRWRAVVDRSGRHAG